MDGRCMRIYTRICSFSVNVHMDCEFGQATKVWTTLPAAMALGVLESCSSSASDAWLQKGWVSPVSPFLYDIYIYIHVLYI